MKITRLELSLSMLVPFLTVFLTFLIGNYSMSYWPMTFEHYCSEFFSLIIFWAPAVLLCLLFELFSPKALEDKKSLRNLLIIETILAALLSFLAFFYILALGIVGNIIRYQLLIQRKRK